MVDNNVVASVFVLLCYKSLYMYIIFTICYQVSEALCFLLINNKIYVFLSYDIILVIECINNLFWIK